ncbi:MAG: hypothetical protein WCH98_14690, partial [Verrucomicrobiota bacterium]
MIAHQAFKRLYLLSSVPALWCASTANQTNELKSVHHAICLHWFDKAFHAKDGPAHAKAVLVRYADDFVVMARYAGGDLQRFIGEKIEGWLGLKIKREKTRVVNLRGEGETLDFLGYSFRLDRDLHGRDRKYWNMHPSKK